MTTTPALLPQPPLPWLLQPWQQIARSLQHGRLPQGLLIAGRDGVGALEFARALAQFLLCTAPTEYISCSKCRGCQLLLSGNHPDIFILKPEDQSVVIKIQQMRELNEFLVNTAQQGGRKVVVIEPADAMNINAANALLKNLEEPIGNTYFILASANPSRLLATIKSRCTRVQIADPSKSQALEWLARNQVADAEAYLVQANGAPLKVIEWLASRYFESSQTLAGHLEGVLLGRTSLAAASKSLLSLGVPMVLDRLIFWLQQAVKSQFDSQVELVLELERLLAGRPASALTSIYDSLLRKRATHLSGNNLNAQLVLDEILIELASLYKN